MFTSPGDLPNPGIKPRSPTLRADSLPAEPPGKPENTGVGSLSLLQWIFLTQESNQGLLHCRRILYQLSYQEPLVKIVYHNSQDMEATSMSIDGCMDREGAAHIYDGILFSHKKERNNTTCSDMDGPKDCHTG